MPIKFNKLASRPDSNGLLFNNNNGQIISSNPIEIDIRVIIPNGQPINGVIRYEIADISRNYFRFTGSESTDGGITIERTFNDRNNNFTRTFKKKILCIEPTEMRLRIDIIIIDNDGIILFPLTEQEIEARKCEWFPSVRVLMRDNLDSNILTCSIL